MIPNKTRISITVSGDTAVVRRGTGSSVVVARVLGVESDGSQERVYLDRRVHRGEDVCEEGELSGGYTTILSRAAVAA